MDKRLNVFSLIVTLNSLVGVGEIIELQPNIENYVVGKRTNDNYAGVLIKTRTDFSYVYQKDLYGTGELDVWESPYHLKARGVYFSKKGYEKIVKAIHNHELLLELEDADYYYPNKGGIPNVKPLF